MRGIAGADRDVRRSRTPRRGVIAKRANPSGYSRTPHFLLPQMRGNAPSPRRGAESVAMIFGAARGAGSENGFRPGEGKPTGGLSSILHLRENPATANAGRCASVPAGGSIPTGEMERGDRPPCLSGATDTGGHRGPPLHPPLCPAGAHRLFILLRGGWGGWFSGRGPSKKPLSGRSRFCCTGDHRGPSLLTPHVSKRSCRDRSRPVGQPRGGAVTTNPLPRNSLPAPRAPEEEAALGVVPVRGLREGGFQAQVEGGAELPARARAGRPPDATTQSCASPFPKQDS